MIITSKASAKVAEVLARFQDKTPLNATEAKEAVKILEAYQQSDAFEPGSLAKSLSNAFSVQENKTTLARKQVWVRALPVRDASEAALTVFEDFVNRNGMGFQYTREDPSLRADLTLRKDATGNARMSQADIRTWANTGGNPNPGPYKDPAPNFKPKSVHLEQSSNKTED